MRFGRVDLGMTTTSCWSAQRSSTWAGVLPWVLAISKGLGVGAMAQVIAPYPTLGETSKRAAGSFYTPGLFSATESNVVSRQSHSPASSRAVRCSSEMS